MKKLLLITALCLLTGLASAQTFYRWVDSNGITHYTTTAPTDQKSASLDVVTGTRHPTINKSQTDDKTDQASASQASDEKDAPVNQFLANCKTYRSNLALLQSDAVLTVKGEDGKPRMLTDKERAQRLTNVESMLTACPPAPAS